MNKSMLPTDQYYKTVSEQLIQELGKTLIDFLDARSTDENMSFPITSLHGIELIVILLVSFTENFYLGKVDVDRSVFVQELVENIERLFDKTKGVSNYEG